MAEANQNLVQDAKTCKFSTIGQDITDDDVLSVWDALSSFINKQMTQLKGVNVPGLGTFTFSQQKLDVGNAKFIMIQRPVFILSEKFSQLHGGLTFSKHHVSVNIPVVPLNFTAVAFEGPFDRDTVEACVREVLHALDRCVAAKRNVEFTFNGIGRLQIRDSKVKMRFFKDFINSMDGSGKLLNALKNRPGTVDSVMSERPVTRCGSSNTLILPKISNVNSNSLALDRPAMPAIQEDGTFEHMGDEGVGGRREYDRATSPVMEYDGGDGDTQKLLKDIDELLGDHKDEQPVVGTDCLKVDEPVGSPAGARLAAPVAKASGVNFADDILSPKPCPSPPDAYQNINASAAAPAQSDLFEPEFTRAHSVDSLNLRKPSPMEPSPPRTPKPASSCGHPNAGQELCYLCHQRARRNVADNFAEEKRRQEKEEERLLEQYRHMKDNENLLKEQVRSTARRLDNEKTASFNLGVADALKMKKEARSTDYYPSYIFQRRPLTPPRYIKQEELHHELADQVESKIKTTKKRKSEEDFLDRMEQVQLAEDLAAQREKFLKDKLSQQDLYKRALSAQVRFKPMPIPGRVPDASLFGKNDMTNEKMLNKRRQAYEMYQGQLQTVEQRKRDMILRKLQEQQDEESKIRQAKLELLQDRADRYERHTQNRRYLEEDWRNNIEMKQARKLEEKLRASSPGMLLLEQCEHHTRCGQCKRKVQNCGESNIWRESRYIPGSRLII